MEEALVPAEGVFSQEEIAGFMGLQSLALSKDRAIFWALCSYYCACRAKGRCHNQAMSQTIGYHGVIHERIIGLVAQGIRQLNEE
jgi:hypothetical protein